MLKLPLVYTYNLKLSKTEIAFEKDNKVNITCINKPVKCLISHYLINQCEFFSALKYITMYAFFFQNGSSSLKKRVATPNFLSQF